MRTVNVSGLSIEKILSKDPSKLNTPTLRAYTTRLVSAANKRIVRFEKQGLSSPALRAVYETGGKFSVKGKNLNQLRHEFMRLKSFIEAPTGNIKGWKEIRKEVITTLSTDNGVNITEKQFDNFWKAYERLKQLDHTVTDKDFKYHIMDDIANMLTTNKSVDDVVSDMEKRIKEIYEKHKSIDDLGTGQFFSYGENP